MKIAVGLRCLCLAAASAAVAFGALVSCSGSGGSGTTGPQPSGKALLTRVEYGRLVDIYAYRRIDRSMPDRRAVTNRTPTLVKRDVAIGPDIQTQELFDAVGSDTGASYRFLPFDVQVGHEELLILWDDSHPDEQQNFNAAMTNAQFGLVEIAGAYRNQNTTVRPIPVVPRNAAIKLTFDHDLGVDTDFLAQHPGIIQLLEFLADPATTPAQQSFRPVPTRLIADGANVLIDTTLIGAEAGGGQTSNGMPVSGDNVTANLRIAIPKDGVVSSSFVVGDDPVPDLNDVDSRGDPSVIRDIRSGNSNDGQLSALVDDELPGIVGDFGMGIIAFDSAQRMVTLNKRGADVAVRARVPFVDGGIASTGFPGGPSQVPTDIALRSGDILSQDVLSPATGEVVRVRAEIIENLDVGTVVGDPAFPGLGLAADGSDGGTSSTVRLLLDNIAATDSQGNAVTFGASPLPLGQDCTVRVHYYHYVPYGASFGSGEVADSGRANEFVVVVPVPPPLDPIGNPVPPGSLIDPNATIALRFSEPLDLNSVQPLDNYLISTGEFRDNANGTVSDLLQEAKPSALSILGTRLLDQQRDGTVLQLILPLGHYHEQGNSESYWFHMLLGSGGMTDLAGNPIDVADRDLLNPLETFSVNYTLDPNAADNLVASRVLRFAASDEDGSPSGSIDYFGQFQISNGELSGAPTTRFSQVADTQQLAGILRIDKGECWDPMAMPAPANVPPGGSQPTGNLYQCPSMVATQNPPPAVFTPPNGPKVFGGILEPHNPRGSRLQMTYREDDFSLSYTDPNTFNIDLEQLYWAPWNNAPLQFDRFDRLTIEAAHADWRPDLLFFLNVDPTGMNPATCDFDCASLNSGLRNTFASNVLEGTQKEVLVADTVFVVDPNAAFQAVTGTTFVPYAKFEKTYTWRDSRLLTWDPATSRAVGLTGAKAPDAPIPSGDRTADVSSPWIPEELPMGFTGTIWTVSEADFRGERPRDHDPIAAPLLLDFKMYPDDPRNGVATGYNKFHIAYVGPCWSGPPGGYYGLGNPFACPGVSWPNFRVHSSGGVDGLGIEQFVDPANSFTATGGWVLDVGMGDPIAGRFQTPPGDDHLQWAQADFVRRVSLVTFGFFDTQMPNRHALTPADFPDWPGAGNQKGLPDFESLGMSRGETYAVSDVFTVIDPPLGSQPAGTNVTVEFRGVDSFVNADSIYDEIADDNYDTRGNLLNPKYACEAFRYATPNSGDTKDQPRLVATNMTPYVVEEDLDQLRDARGFLPRYMNLRIVFENNINISPPQTPSLRSLSVIYRVESR